ncbi:DUF4424 domain-containing protein [Pseudoxanthobacter sp. M-2]|uniref:DUF4424 domain-containing protein n=1 Tax=Pseudoxanthobacter sp. M-2 TaxID=3078754 RepID=UPI0038FD06B2
MKAVMTVFARPLAAALVIGAVGIAGLAGPAAANDSSAELAAGGLVFVHNDAIEMHSEDLFVSTRLVRVKYRFFNRTDEDIVSLVAFPMPDITISSAEQNISFPTEDPVRLLDFTTEVNGAPVENSVEQRVTARGLDRTALLTGMGIPLAPHLRSTNMVLDGLPADQWDKLVRLGLAEVVEYDDDGTGMKRHLEARWTLHTTFYREQRFPAGAETLVEHRYVPSVGLSVGSMIGQPGAASDPYTRPTIDKYCVDKSFLAAAERAAKKAEGGYLAEQRVGYILTTGANWAGPIGDFRLVVDKGAPDNLVSFCAEGVTKIGPTLFEVRKTDYVPTENLDVLILTRSLQ